MSHKAISKTWFDVEKDVFVSEIIARLAEISPAQETFIMAANLD